jgi:hypothetical protein
MQRLTVVLKKQIARFALACVVAFGVSTSVFAQSNLVNVEISLTVDNFYALFAVDPNTGLLTLIGSDPGPVDTLQWKTVETYSFLAPRNSYLYVIGRDSGVAAMFVSKTVFDNSVTVLTGIPNPFAEWEVNTIYRPYPQEDFLITDPGQVLNWGGGWQAPAVGRFVVPQDATNIHPSFDLFKWTRLWRAVHLGTAGRWKSISRFIRPVGLRWLHRHGHSPFPPAGGS